MSKASKTLRILELENELDDRKSDVLWVFCFLGGLLALALHKANQLQDKIDVYESKELQSASIKADKG